MDYTLKRMTNTTRITIRIHPDGTVLVTAPRLATRRQIDEFVASRTDWITKHRPRQLGRGLLYAIFGRDYRLDFGYRPHLPTGWQVIDETLFYNSSAYLFAPKAETTLTADEKSKLDLFARRTLRHYIDGRLPVLHEQMRIPVAIERVTIKNQASRWGSCSTDNNLNFNVNLIHFPPAVIDYVLIHELAHMIHHNHSAAFWALVAKHDGQYKLHRQQLNH